MRSRWMATMCAVASVAVVGCGGGSASSSSSSSSVAGVSAKALCPSVLASEQRYQSARANMSIQFEKRAVEVPTRKAAEQFVGKVQQLFPAGTAEQKRQLATFAAALSNQVNLLRAFERHDKAEISRYGNVPSSPLRQGLIDLHAICAQAK
jgi:hypothetical protein